MHLGGLPGVGILVALFGEGLGGFLLGGVLGGDVLAGDVPIVRQVLGMKSFSP